MYQAANQCTGTPGGSSDEMVRCCACKAVLPVQELEGHICLEHLDYFPYSCGHCGHYLATEVLAHFHSNRKHEQLPMKVTETCLHVITWFGLSER